MCCFNVVFLFLSVLVLLVCVNSVLAITVDTTMFIMYEQTTAVLSTKTNNL